VNVAHITPSFYPATRYGGPPQSTYRLCRSAAHAGANVRVLTTDADGSHHVLTNVPVGTEHRLEPGLTVRYEHRQRPESLSAGLLRVLPEIIQWADVVHLTAVYSFPTFPTLALCRRWNKPVVWTPRGALERWPGTTRPAAKAVWETFCRVLLPAHIAMHVTSDREKEQSVRRFPKLSMAVIPNGVDIPAMAPARRQEPELRLLYLGRLDPKKGLENLLEACAGLKNVLERPWTLTIAGEGTPAYEASLHMRSQQLSLGNQVRWVGRVEGEAKEACFAKSDWTIVPSYTENFCMVVAEALARAVPVIASKGTPWEGLEAAGCGLWVDNSPAVLTQAIASAARLDTAMMGARGRAWMQSAFSWEKTGRDMVALYKRLVQENS
jgi:glycosyltransferase involved in cell wall biosynthesis